MSDDNETRDRQPEGRRPAWQSGTPRGQERVVSYESDERYWTDYLRVALPVVGLLLMLGLLFWWTNSIIGDDQGSEPTATVAVSASNVAEADTSTPPSTVEPNLTPATVFTDPTTPDATEGNGTETPSEDPTEEPNECDGDFKRGDTVQISEQETNFRSQPNLEPGEYPQPPVGTQFEITTDCYTLAEEDGETRFWRVDLIDSVEGLDDNARGWVFEGGLELVEE